MFALRGSPNERASYAKLVHAERGVEVAELMAYRGELVEVFAWTPGGQAVPRLRAEIDGENVGDYAFVNGTAMEWNGQSWVPSPWKDFAVWKTAESQPADG